MRKHLSCNRRRCLGLAVAAAGLAASAGVQAQAHRHSGSRNTISVAVAPGAASSTVRNGLDELFLGHRAVAEGDTSGADMHYREAWQDPAVRADAGEALHRLYQTPGFTVPTDESTVRRNLNLLGDGFRRYETQHFVLLSDSDPAWTMERGRMLERARDQYFRVAQNLNLPTFPHQTKLVCVLFDHHTDYQAFARRNDGLEARWVAGYYATASNRVVFYNDATSPAYTAQKSRIQTFEQELREKRDEAEQASRRRQTARARQLLSSAEELETRIKRERDRIGQRAAAYSTAKTVHEAIHLLAFNTGMQLGDRDYPFWLSEGLATSFETDNAALSFGPDRGASSGTREQRYDELRRQGRLRPLRELVGMTEAPTHDAQAAEAMYSQSYALFSHLFRTNPTGVGQYLQALLGEDAGRISARRHEELFEQHFGAPEEIEEAMASGY